MSKVHVVEVRRLTDEAVEVPIARFVLTPAGEARLIELRPRGQSLVEMLLREGVPGPEGTQLFPQDGLRLHAAAALSPACHLPVGHGSF